MKYAFRCVDISGAVVLLLIDDQPLLAAAQDVGERPVALAKHILGHGFLDVQYLGKFNGIGEVAMIGISHPAEGGKKTPIAVVKRTDVSELNDWFKKQHPGGVEELHKAVRDDKRKNWKPKKEAGSDGEES